MKKKFIQTQGKTPAFLTSDCFVDRADIEFLKEFAVKNGTVARILLHGSNEDGLHNMIICAPKSKVQMCPHKHEFKDETYHWIDGEAAIVFVDINGRETKRYILNRDTLVVRVPKQTYHMVTPLSDYVVFHESRPGPFEESGDSIELKEMEFNDFK